jgi:hypothetical protein
MSAGPIHSSHWRTSASSMGKSARLPVKLEKDSIPCSCRRVLASRQDQCIRSSSACAECRIVPRAYETASSISKPNRSRPGDSLATAQRLSSLWSCCGLGTACIRSRM